MIRIDSHQHFWTYNATDYVEYLRKVFANEPEMMKSLARWGTEEVQHGEALGRWAEMADPTFNFQEAFARFRKAYRPAHFINADGSVRGSRVGELIARAVKDPASAGAVAAEVTGLVERFPAYDRGTVSV